MEKIHATCIEFSGVGVLITGPSGSGKSDLALRLIDSGARLVADDWTEISSDQGKLIARCPPPISGLLEVRGIGIISFEPCPEIEILLIIDLVASSEVERLPDYSSRILQGIELPLVKLNAFEISALNKVLIAARLANGSVKRHDT